MDTDQRPIILTVEDEVLVSEFLGDLLRDEGYCVIATQNADEAIAVLEARSDIRVVITDINMPGSMDGLKLAAAVRHRWPPIKIIVATGRAPPPQDELPSECVFLSKPYVPRTLLEKVHALA
jgi:CheY-like chemotaxis protein